MTLVLLITQIGAKVANTLAIKARDIVSAIFPPVFFSVTFVHSQATIITGDRTAPDVTTAS